MPCRAGRLAHLRREVVVLRRQRAAQVEHPDLLFVRQPGDDLCPEHYQHSFIHSFIAGRTLTGMPVHSSARNCCRSKKSLACADLTRVIPVTVVVVVVVSAGPTGRRFGLAGSSPGPCAGPCSASSDPPLPRSPRLGPGLRAPARSCPLSSDEAAAGYPNPWKIFRENSRILLWLTMLPKLNLRGLCSERGAGGKEGQGTDRKGQGRTGQGYLLGGGDSKG